MDGFVQDLRVGLRLLLKQRGFSATVALTLAVCFGANVALFSVVNNVLLRPLPMPESDRIVIVGNEYPKAGAAGLRAVAVPDYFDHLREMTTFEEQAVYNNANLNLDVNGTPTRFRALNVTPSFFRVLRVQPVRGRTFTDDEGETGNERKIVLSYGLWQSAFGGDPNVVGREIRIDGPTYTIVGIMPQDFVYQRADIMLWRPIAFTAQQKSDDSRHSNNYQQIARLKPGATIERAQAEIDALNARNLDRFPQWKELVVNAGFHTVVAPLQDDMVRDVKRSLYLMWGGALFVLFIGCVNVANLVLARSRARLREIATRVALGAGRVRIARQLITESVALTLISAVAGLALGWTALRLFGLLNIQDLPRGSEIRLDWVAGVITLAAAGAIGFVLGLIPAAGVSVSRLAIILREEGRAGTGGRSARVLRRSLIVAQVAFAFVLLIGAGLLVASFQQVLRVDPGFEPDGVLTASIVIPRTRYPDNPAMLNFVNQSLERIRALPGVKAAGTTSNVPLSGINNSSVIFAEGYQMRPGESAIAPSRVNVSPGFFEAMNVRVVSGRFFDEQDHVIPVGSPTVFGGPQPRVAIIDDRLARRFWPGQDAVGHRLYLPTDPKNLMAITKDTSFIEIVGVVREIKLQSLTQEEQAVGAYYFPVAQVLPTPQATAFGFSYAIRTSGQATALAAPVRQAIASLDREAAVFDTLTMEERVDRSLVTRRSPMILAVSFGVVGLFLSAVGIYGVLAYVVAQRMREIGIRIALGSSRRQIFDLILREGLVLLAAGFVLGSLGAMALRQSLQSQLFGITATNPIVLAAVGSLLAFIAVAACALPARRATRIDPVIALAD